MLTEVFSKGLIAFLGNEINIEIAATVATVLAILMLLAQASKSGVAIFSLIKLLCLPLVWPP